MPVGIPPSKRIFDLVFTIPGAIVISPIILVLAVLVRVKLGSPILSASSGRDTKAGCLP